VSSNQNSEAKKPAANDIAANEDTQPAGITPPPSLEDAPASSSETSSLQTETSMEVHHHAHTERKKWTHYFWEFFMLFLAVTLGFLVENQREHYIEHQRAKQYASALYKDLIKDTVTLNERTEFMVAGTKALDTLIAILQSFEDNNEVPKIYALSAYAYSGAFFGATTSTIEQLKNSGSLRYFQGYDLVPAFSEYDSDLQRLKQVEERNIYLNEEIRIFLTQFLDVKNISRFTVDTATNTSGFQLAQPSAYTSLRLYKTGKEQLQQYGNLCALKQLDWGTRIGLQTRLLKSARTLIASLKKEYKLE